MLEVAVKEAERMNRAGINPRLAALSRVVYLANRRLEGAGRRARVVYDLACGMEFRLSIMENGEEDLGALVDLIARRDSSGRLARAILEAVLEVEAA